MLHRSFAEYASSLRTHDCLDESRAEFLGKTKFLTSVYWMNWSGDVLRKLSEKHYLRRRKEYCVYQLLDENQKLIYAMIEICAVL